MDGQFCSVAGKLIKCHDFQYHVSPFRKLHELGGLNDPCRAGQLMNDPCKGTKRLLSFFIAPAILPACSVVVIVELEGTIKRSKKTSENFRVGKSLEYVFPRSIKFPDDKKFLYAFFSNDFCLWYHIIFGLIVSDELT